MDKMKTYTVYGLRVKGENLFFYIGCSCNLPKRLEQHFKEARSGNTLNPKKCLIITQNNFEIELIPLEDAGNGPIQAGIKEKRIISDYFAEGHPLVNVKIGEVDTKQIVFRIPIKLADELKTIADEQKRSVSSLIAEVLEVAAKNMNLIQNG